MRNIWEIFRRSDSGDSLGGRYANGTWRVDRSVGVTRQGGTKNGAVVMREKHIAEDGKPETSSRDSKTKLRR